MAIHILTTGKGKNKRQWQLNDSEFDVFEAYFSENEVVDIPDVSKLRLVEVPPPERKPAKSKK